MKKIIKDALILFAITFVAGLLLALVNEVTKTPIAEAAARQKEEACKMVFEEASAFEQVDNINNVISESNSKVTIREVYTAKNSNNEVIGYVFNILTKEGYGGDISFVMGVDNSRKLNGISVLSSSETVGLGLEADKVLAPQFKNKTVDVFTYTKTGSANDSEIDAISSATITTNAYVNAVNAGLAYFDIISNQ